MNDVKTVVIGLDGAHFELIQSWVADGKLPNIAQAIENGVATDTESVLPPVTSPNWKAYATGKNPGKLGIFWWENVDVADRRVYYPSDRKNAHTEFWEILGNEDSIGVLGVPTTYPPKNVNGFLVAGAPDADGSGYAYPEQLENELKREYSYDVTKRNRLSVDREAAIDEILELIDARFSVGKALAEEYDVSFLQITTFYLNSLHHFLWEDKATLRGWQIVDEHLTEFLNDETNLILMSDHGSTEIDTVFHINTWLQKKGYLTLNTTASDYLHRVGLTKERLINLAYALRIPRLAEKLAPETLIQLLPSQEGELSRESKTTAVAWNQSTALASGQGPVYLNLDRDSDRYETFRSNLIEGIENISGPNGNPVANRVLRGESVYDGKYMNEAPDIVVDQRNGVHITGSIGREEVFTDPTDDGWRAENKRTGLFVATGPDFATGSIDNLSILDLAPMILHLHECAVPRDMDGCVPKSVFAEGTSPAERDVEFQSQTEKIRERRRIQAIARDLSL